MALANTEVRIYVGNPTGTLRFGEDPQAINYEEPISLRNSLFIRCPGSSIEELPAEPEPVEPSEDEAVSETGISPEDEPSEETETAPVEEEVADEAAVEPAEETES